ncbi:hypothetical protein D9758_012886 [Tetrapyrgos nigripes]|uniref:Uncharacterized protein n=1 Tax=Tetrapyrgos nigripes TaxID=182062 RepID=A0A8H5CLL2_9AGAR|nr:hypothetical protein D9758_012886 [Tetrapyrgos nigripes]
MSLSYELQELIEALGPRFVCIMSVTPYNYKSTTTTPTPHIEVLQMPTKSSKPSKPTTPRRESNRPPPKPSQSPAHSIAEAWRQESSESKESWRRLDEDLRRKYNEARHGRRSKL